MLQQAPLEQGISLCENGPFYVARRSTGKFTAVAQAHMPLIDSLKLTSSSNQRTFSYFHTVFHETFDSTILVRANCMRFV